MAAPSAAVDELEAAAYTIPTDARAAPAATLVLADGLAAASRSHKARAGTLQIAQVIAALSKAISINRRLASSGPVR